MSGRAQHGLSNTIAISLINRFPKKLLTLLEVTVAFTNKYSNTQILKQTVSQYCRVLQSIAEYCRLLQNIAEYCRFLQNIAEYCRVLQSVRELLQSISSPPTWTNFWPCFLIEVLIQVLFFPCCRKPHLKNYLCCIGQDLLLGMVFPPI